MSDFLGKKLRTHFRHLDINNDGHISMQELLDIGMRHCDAEKATAVERERTRECFYKVWQSLMKFTDSGDNGLLTTSIFVDSIKQQRNDPEFKERYLTMCHQFFHIMDLNGDGFLQEDEYSRALAQAGIRDTSSISRAFESMDLNKDGKLSIEEFSGPTALLEYLTSEDENSPYKELWGPLG